MPLLPVLLLVAVLGGDTLRTPGLYEPVEILKDKSGVSHIYAKNEHDLFFAQGYSAARDRLFQLEIWRRQAAGTVSEAMRIVALPSNRRNGPGPSARVVDEQATQLPVAISRAISLGLRMIRSFPKEKSLGCRRRFRRAKSPLFVS